MEKGENFIPGIFICPHFNSIDLKLFNQVFTKTSAIRGENENLFMFTHYPIILYDHNEKSTNTREEDVLKQILKKDRLGNFTIAIEGETGTGKSELCIFLYHKLKKIMPVLRISKNSDLLTILADDIPKFYEDNTGNILDGSENLKELKRELKTNPSILANKIGYNAISLLLRNYPNLKLSDNDRRIKYFIKFLEKQLMQLITSTGEEYPSEINFITEEDIKSGERDFSFGIKKTPKKIADELNECIWNAIKKNESIPSIDVMLSQINNEMKERWAIIFEDFSISSLDKNRLKNFIERDDINDKTNFILAGLEDKLQILHTPTAEDRREERIIFYKTSKTGENKVLFLDERNCVEFIKPYICYFKSLDGSLYYHKKNNSLQLRIGEGKTKCNNCNKCSKEERDLFPLNAIFLKRIYQGLKEEDKKPRKYVEIVGIILRDYFINKVIPSDAYILNLLKNEYFPPESIIKKNKENLINFLRWYAEFEEDKISVSKRYLNLFGIDSQGIADMMEVGDTLIIPIKKKGMIEGPGQEIGKKQIKPQWEKEYDKLKGYITNWRDNPYGKNWSRLNEYLIEILSDIIEYITQNYFFDKHLKLKLRIGKNESIFTFNKQNYSEKPDLNCFQISLNSKEFTYNEINLLLFNSIKKNFKIVDKKNILIEILSKIPYNVLEGIEEWEKKCSLFFNGFKFFKKSLVNIYEISDIWITYSLISFIIQDPWKEFNFNNFSVFLKKENQDFKIPEYLSPKLYNKQDFKKKMDEFFSQTKFANNLTLNTFMILNTKNIDTKTFYEQSHYYECVVFDILWGITRTSINQFPKNRILINIKNESLRFEDLILTYYTFGSFLKENKTLFDIDFAEIKNDLELIKNALNNIDFQKMEKYINKISQYSNVNKDLIFNLKLFLRNKIELKKFLKATEFILNLIEEYNSSEKNSKKKDFIKFRISLAYLKILTYNDLLNLIKNIYNNLKIPAGYISNINNLLNLRNYLV
ncbi:MAG: hypothetical protein ACTSVV_08270 [Promethearchaeota archaeon]